MRKPPFYKANAKWMSVLLSFSLMPMIVCSGVTLSNANQVVPNQVVQASGSYFYGSPPLWGLLADASFSVDLGVKVVDAQDAGCDWSYSWPYRWDQGPQVLKTFAADGSWAKISVIGTLAYAPFGITFWGSKEDSWVQCDLNGKVTVGGDGPLAYFSGGGGGRMPYCD